MIRQIRLFLFAAALFTSVAVFTSAAARPSAAQTASSSAKKKKKTSSASSSKSRSTKTVSKKSTASKSKGKSRTRTAAKPKGQSAPTADRIREIQTALQKDGSYEGEPTGKWDSETSDAMRKYQDKNGISPTGKIDAISLNKMGLGSETAGKGAPIPSANATAAPGQTPASKPSPTTTTPPAAE